MSKKSKVLIVSFIPPFPLEHGGNRQVIYNLLLWLKKNNYYIIFYYQKKNISDDIKKTFLEIVDELYIAEKEFEDVKDKYIFYFLKIIKLLPISIYARLKSLYYLIINGRANIVSNNNKCWPESVDIVADIVKEKKVDVIISQYIYMVDTFIKLPKNVLKVIHTHDMLSRVKDEIGAYGVDTHGRECSAEEERKALLKGDVIVALQENEARLFKQLVPERRVIILGHSPRVIVDEPYKNIIPGRVFMIGGDNSLNRRGLVLFLEYVWPRVLKEVPFAELRVVGPVGTSLPEGTPNAVALGRLQDVDTEYLEANLVVNPVDLGTGLKIKSVEALCFGKCLISTVAGVEGLMNDGKKAWIVTDNWDDFAGEIITICQNQPLRKSIEKEAIKYAKKYFSEDYIYRELHDVIENKQ